ncbi:hypothetical protein WJX77_009441 [Trebouxia sp. C0004]
MASAVKKHNKLSINRRLPGGEQQQVVTTAKFQLNPMHLLVQQAYFSAKKQLFDKEAWVHDYFQLASEDTQKQLTQYLAMDMPPQLQGAAQTERLAWLTTQASHELVAFVDTISQRLSVVDQAKGRQPSQDGYEQARVTMEHKYNQSAPKDNRDLGGVLLLMCFIILKRIWWQLAPLLEEEVPAHPFFTLGFMQDARISGSRRACLLPPHLVVARLLEPVHEALKNGGEPDEVLQSQIWRFAGEILKEVPGPVQVAEAVHTLMGRQPPIQDPLNSPVQQVSERQARTSEALNAISQTAQAVRQQQQSQGAQQQRSADPQSSNFASQVLQRPQQELQVDIAQQMQAAMATAACSDDAYLSAEQRSMRQMAVQMATACMAPVLQVMKQRDEAHQAERDS